MLTVSFGEQRSFLLRPEASCFERTLRRPLVTTPTHDSELFPVRRPRHETLLHAMSTMDCHPYWVASHPSWIRVFASECYWGSRLCWWSKPSHNLIGQ